MTLFYYPNLNIYQYEKKFISKLVVLLLGLPFLITCMLKKEVVKRQIGEDEVWLYDLKDLFKTDNLWLYHFLEIKISPMHLSDTHSQPHPQQGQVNQKKKKWVVRSKMSTRSVIKCLS